MRTKTYIILHLESEWLQLDIDDPKELLLVQGIDPFSTYITVQLNDFIRHLKSEKVGRLPAVIDFESLTKQTLQSGNDDGVKKSWSALRLLRELELIDSEFKLTRTNALEFMVKLAEAYKSELGKNDIEQERFNNIERPVNNILCERQFKGVRIDREKAEERCRELEEKMYEIKNELQHEHSIYDPENEKFQLEYLKNKNYRLIQSLQYTLRTRRKTDELCGLLYELSRIKRDLNSILIMLTHYGGRERVHPSYKGFGTITSRITMRDPSIQNMRRTNRDLILPESGKEFCYVDYGQFEAGILASLSKDKKLISLYNEDIYSDIAKKVLRNPDDREEAKIIFYRFMYGDTTLSKDAYRYFERFKSLNSYIKEIGQELKENGVVYSPFGNGRKKSEKSSWGLSHKIQSTASLIYKKALIRVNKEVSDASFVIPMHDATLYEIMPSKKEETTNEIVRIYKEEFKSVCPELEPQVSLKKFYE